MYSDKTTWHLQWKILFENRWKRHFQGSNFQNVPRCLDPQELVRLMRVPKLPTVHFQPATLKLFDCPAIIEIESNHNEYESLHPYIMLLLQLNLFGQPVLTNGKCPQV